MSADIHLRQARTHTRLLLSRATTFCSVGRAILYRGACYFVAWRLLFCTVARAIFYRGACYFVP
jgi:hypothetical protein